MISDSKADGHDTTAGGLDAEAGAPVVLTTLYDPIEAEIIVSKLRSAGIDCYLRHESAGMVIGLTVDGMGQQEIMVRPEDLQEARAALEEDS